MDVVVHHQVAILQVLAFGKAVGSDEDVDFPLFCSLLRLFLPLLCPGGEPPENFFESGYTQGRLVAVAASHQGDVNIKFVLRPILKMVV